MLKKTKEVRRLKEYLENAMEGKAAQDLQLSDRDVQEISEKTNVLLDYKASVGSSSVELLDVLGNISSFDIGLSHISNDLTKFAGNLASFAESNLATVEETTASMHQVNDQEFWNQEFMKGRSQKEYNEAYYQQLEDSHSPYYHPKAFDT